VLKAFVHSSDSKGLLSSQLGSTCLVMYPPVQLPAHVVLHGIVPDDLAAWCYREGRLPEGMVRNGNVQKDSVLTFTRAGNGRVTAAANGTELTTGADALAVLSQGVIESPCV
jgi:hypothetical protein